MSETTAEVSVVDTTQINPIVSSVIADIFTRVDQTISQTMALEFSSLVPIFKPDGDTTPDEKKDKHGLTQAQNLPQYDGQNMPLDHFLLEIETVKPLISKENLVLFARIIFSKLKGDAKLVTEGKIFKSIEELTELLKIRFSHGHGSRYYNTRISCLAHDPRESVACYGARLNHLYLQLLSATAQEMGANLAPQHKQLITDSVLSLFRERIPYHIARDMSTTASTLDEAINSACKVEKLLQQRYNTFTLGTPQCEITTQLNPMISGLYNNTLQNTMHPMGASAVNFTPFVPDPNLTAPILNSMGNTSIFTRLPENNYATANNATFMPTFNSTMLPNTSFGPNVSILARPAEMSQLAFEPVQTKAASMNQTGGLNRSYVLSARDSYCVNCKTSGHTVLQCELHMPDVSSLSNNEMRNNGEQGPKNNFNGKKYNNYNNSNNFRNNGGNQGNQQNWRKYNQGGYNNQNSGNNGRGNFNGNKNYNNNQGNFNGNNGNYNNNSGGQNFAPNFQNNAPNVQNNTAQLPLNSQQPRQNDALTSQPSTSRQDVPMVQRNEVSGPSASTTTPQVLG